MSEGAGKLTGGPGGSGVGAFAIRHRLAIIFITVAVCLGGIYSALRMPSSVFPEITFDEVALLANTLLIA